MIKLTLLGCLPTMVITTDGDYQILKQEHIEALTSLYCIPPEHCIRLTLPPNELQQQELIQQQLVELEIVRAGYEAMERHTLYSLPILDSCGSRAPMLTNANQFNKILYEWIEQAV